MEQAFTREDYVFLANMALNTNRFQEMVEYVNKFTYKVQELSVEERSLLSIAYK